VRLSITEILTTVVNVTENLVNNVNRSAEINYPKEGKAYKTIFQKTLTETGKYFFFPFFLVHIFVFCEIIFFNSISNDTVA
jgi:hypothetical protein